jgi:hypothetical protein
MSFKVHFDMSMSPPAYSPPPAYLAHDFDGITTFAQKERLASIAEHKLGYLVSQKRREPSLRQVLLHAGFLERVLDSLDASHPEDDDEPMIEEKQESEYVAAPEVHSSLTTIVEEEMEEDEDEDEDEEMEDEDEEEGAPLRRTLSHRPGSPVSDDSDSDDDLPSPPPQYTAPDHPLFNLFEVREKARREELSHHYKIDHEPENLFLLNHNLAVAA